MPETSSSSPATLQITVGISKAVVSLSFLSWMNFSFPVLLLSIHKRPLLNSQLAICSQPSTGEQGSAVIVGGESHEGKVGMLTFALQGALSAHIQNAGRFGEQNTREEQLIKHKRTNPPGN